MIDTMVIERFAHTPFGTFGRLTYGVFSCFTVECEWQNNTRGISCVPVGEYELRREYYYDGDYNTIGISDVPNREYIKFHIANTEDDLKGCVALGLELGFVGANKFKKRKGKWGVLRSKDAFDQFMAAMPKQLPRLLIRNLEGQGGAPKNNVIA